MIKPYMEQRVEEKSTGAESRQREIELLRLSYAERMEDHLRATLIQSGEIPLSSVMKCICIVLGIACFDGSSVPRYWELLLIFN